jgi:coproporphyrinogen III oxidase
MFEALSQLRNEAESYFKYLQDEITSALELLDGTSTFREDSWERPGGGGGRTRVLENGMIFEKAGVNFSAVFGEAPKNLQQDSQTKHQFYATGISMVLHAQNPHVPTIHANFRFFQLSSGEAWFGGGIDLTPNYIVEPDIKEFHAALKTTCDKHDASYYSRFKKWCDEYFYIKHRKETRGVGGLFFDHLKGTEDELEKIFLFVKEAGNAFLPLYLPIVERNYNEPFTDEQKRWQLLRRGRYVEFNLLYDKGTLFGLETEGRIESILMSLPSLARWDYDAHPSPGCPEDEMLQILKKPKEWV